jgi:hypothetical protein
VTGIQPLGAQAVLEARGTGHAAALSQFTTMAAGHREIRAGEIESTLVWADVVNSIADLGEIALNVHSVSGRWAVATVGDATVLVEHSPAWGEYSVTVAAVDGTYASKILAGVFELIPGRPAANDDTVDLHFWMEHPMMGAVSQRRAVERLPWSATAANYPASIRPQLAELAALTDAPANGRLLVFHGEPGTGKSRFIQTLADAWQPWCTINYVVDADAMFDSALYMNMVMTGDDHAGNDRWRLVVVEDGDEFIDTDAKSRSGHAIARLLNLADGLVGQGLKVMVAVSTNVPETNFAAAVVRTGRCGALIEFPRFEVDEATAWCADRGVPATFDSPTTLAELYAALRGKVAT